MHFSADCMSRFVLAGFWKSESAKENTVRKCHGIRRRLRSVPRQHRRFAIEHGNEIVDLLNVHGERLYRLLVRFTLREDVAEDLLQDLAVKLSKASGFAAAEDVYAYARKAAVNLGFSWMRSRRRRRERAFEPDDLLNPLHPDADPPFGYIRPNQEPIDGPNPMVLYEPFVEWSGMVAVVYQDHSLEYIHDQAQFDKLVREAADPCPPDRLATPGAPGSSAKLPATITPSPSRAEAAASRVPAAHQPRLDGARS